MTAAVLAAQKLGLTTLYLPFDPYMPKVEMEGLELIFVETLKDVMDLLAGQQKLSFVPVWREPEQTMEMDRDFSQIIGQPFAKRAMEIAASGEHGLLMEGPPGCGKSLLADTFRSILPPLSKEAQLEMLCLYQLAGASYSSLNLPPYRHPHHSASSVSIIGGGSNPKPGEVSLAHRGVLFLDELGEFTKKTLDMLRQPLENGMITISRAHSTVHFPAQFIFIAAMNPCPCGYLGAPHKYCTCSMKQVNTYKNRISGPILDRIDILLTLQPEKLDGQRFGSIESSAQIRERVVAARKRQYARYKWEVCNAKVPFEELVQSSPLSPTQQEELQQLSMKVGMSNRVQIKIIRIARTIADLNGEEHISDDALQEALLLRQIEKDSESVMAGEKQSPDYGR
jgi:magnesium chelatase family protein